MYNINKTFNNVLNEILEQDGFISVNKDDNLSKTKLVTNITSSNNTALSVNIKPGLIELTPSETLVHNVTTSNEDILTTTIANGTLHLNLAEKIVSNIDSDVLDTDYYIENNTLMIRKKNVFIDSKKYDPNVTYAKGDIITHNNLSYKVLNDGIMQALTTSNVELIHNLFNSNKLIFYVKPSTSISENGMVINSVSSNGRVLYSLLTNNVVQSTIFNFIEPARSITFNDCYANTNYYTTFNHIGNYTLFIGGKFNIVDKGDYIFFFKQNEEGIEYDHLQSPYLRGSATKENTLDCLGVDIPYVNNSPISIFICVSGEGRLGGAEMDIYVNNGTNVYYSQFDHSITHCIKGNLIIKSNDNIISNNSIIDLSSFGIVTESLDYADVMDINQYIQLDLCSSEDILIMCDYNFNNIYQNKVIDEDGVESIISVSIDTDVTNNLVGYDFKLTSTSDSAPAYSTQSIMLGQLNNELVCLSTVEGQPQKLSFPLTMTLQTSDIIVGVSPLFKFINIDTQNFFSMYVVCSDMSVKSSIYYRTNDDPLGVLISDQFDTLALTQNLVIIFNPTMRNNTELLECIIYCNTRLITVFYIETTNLDTFTSFMLGEDIFADINSVVRISGLTLYNKALNVKDLVRLEIL